MSAARDHARMPQSMKRRLAQRRYRCVLAMLLGVLLSQLAPAPVSSLLPSGLPGLTTAHAATAWYVDQANPIASDANSCASSSSPCKTIAGALGKAASGDTVNINPGIYNECLIVGVDLTLLGAGASSTTIDGTGCGTVITVNSGSTVSMTGLTIQNGSTGFGGAGGGINSAGALTLDHVVVQNNSASYDGGGISQNAGSLTILSSTIANNTLTYFNGGGLHVTGGASVTIQGSTFTGNHSGITTRSFDGDGGAIFTDAGTITITNSTISGNVAGRAGGGIALRNTGAVVNLDHTTISNNTANGSNTGGAASGGGGGGIINYNLGSGYGTVNVKNTIVASNTASNDLPSCPNVNAGVASQGHNLVDDTSCSSGFGAADLLGVNPNLGPLADNGGPTQTQSPSNGSAAIGAGTCADLSNNPVKVDQRGVSRPVSACTIGAFEADQANDTWTSALTLNQTSGSYQVTQTVSQHIYAQAQDRWYKFAVTPGSSVHVQYSGLPGAVLSLHSDLQNAYTALTNPTSAALESAKDAASGFLPQQFLPQQFLPQQFLPQQFLPQQFLPQQFLPQQFLPQQFLPQQFLPQQFLPQQFLPGPYSGAIDASLLAFSAVPNAGVQTIDHDTWNSSGYMYVRVAGPASSSTPFTLTVAEAGGLCAGVTTTPFTPPAAAGLPSGLKTLILWDSTRITGTVSDISILGTKLGQFASRPEVQGTIVDLSQIPGIDGSGSAQQQADANPACPTAKNAVANDIKAVIQAYRAQNPALQYIVLVGDDRSIPFFRYPDESGLAPESQYYPPVADSSASNASLRDNYVLGQDEYGASLDFPLGDVSLPLPDLAVGRLVKTAAEVSHMLDVYTAANGLITPTSSLVTGYDFVADAATNAQAELQAGTNATPDTLIQPQGVAPSGTPDPPTWTANDLRQKLFGSRHDLVFLAGHFSAGNLEAADYATTLGANEVASSTVDMSNTLVLALGCHGGYNIPAGDAVPNVSPAPDWPEALAEKGATFLSATGYAYGDTVLTEYGEHLFDNYVHQLRSYAGASYVPVAVGQANVAAKKDYLATHTALTGVDEKTLLETTLYGLPMLQVNMPGQHVAVAPPTSIIAAASVVSSGPGQQFGLAIGQTSSGSPDIDVQPTITSHTVPLTNSLTNAPLMATYLTGPNNGAVARPGEPIFPSQPYDVHVPNQILRGVGFRGGSYVDTPHVTPLTAAAGTETSVGHPAFYSNVLYPAQVWTANYFDAIGGGSEQLATTPAQYVSTSPGSTDGTLRQFGDLTFRLFYLPGNWPTTPISQAALAAPPQITGVAATADSSGNVTFDVHVSSDQSAGTQGVWITYTDPSHPGTWQSLDLSQSGADPTLWTATQSLPGSIVFMVQAVNGTGLVSLSTNSGAFYTIGTPPTVTTPTTLTVQSAPSAGVYQTTSGTFRVQLQAVDNGGPTPLSGQLVTLQLGSQQALGTTGVNGTASITLPLSQPPGSYTVVATFAGATAQGTSYQASSSAPGTFTIAPAPTTLSLAPASGASAIYGAPVPVTATLTDNSASGLLQRTVLFTVTGNGLTYNKTAITDYLGRAALGAVPLPTGTYSVAAAFGGADRPVQIVAAGSTVTESDPNYLTSAASPVSFTITPPPLSLTLALTSSPAGPVTTGSVVTASVTLANHTATAQTVSVPVTLAYTGNLGNLKITVPLSLRLNAGQTLSQSVRFTITSSFPRGTYMLSATAKDGSGDTASSSATLTVS